MAQIDIKFAHVRVKDGYGASGAINNKLADPSAAPTVSATGGGSTGGTLTAGNYIASYTFNTAAGETLRSPDSTVFTVASGNIPRVTLPVLPVGATFINLYLSTAGGASSTETKFNTVNITSTTIDLTANHTGTAFPSSNTATLTPVPIGTTAISVRGFTSSTVPLVGDPLVFADDRTIYTITSVTLTSSVPTDIGISPGLVVAQTDGVVVTYGPHQLEFRIGTGNITYDEKRQMIYVKNRGLLDIVREGEEEPMDIKMDFTWEFLSHSSGDTVPTIEEALKHEGLASTWVSSETDLCQPYCVDVEIEYQPQCSNVDRELIDLKKFRYESLNHDLKQGMVAIAGKCNTKKANLQRLAG